MTKNENLRIVEIDVRGTEDINIYMGDYFGFFMEIKTRTQDIISALPEFKQKRKEIRVVFVVEGMKSNQKPDSRVEEKIEVDIRKNIKGINAVEEMREAIVNFVVETLKRELPNITASPPQTLKFITETKKPWWKFW